MIKGGGLCADSNSAPAPSFSHQSDLLYGIQMVEREKARTAMRGGLLRRKVL